MITMRNNCVRVSVLLLKCWDKMKKYDWYILFKNHTEAMTLYRGLKEAKIAVRISPTPRQASVCCGVSLLIADEDMASVRQYLEKTGALMKRSSAFLVKLKRNAIGFARHLGINMTNIKINTCLPKHSYAILKYKS